MIPYYKGDDEFPVDARLLIDQSAANFLEFEFLMVLVTTFVEQLIEKVSTSSNSEEERSAGDDEFKGVIGITIKDSIKDL